MKIYSLFAAKKKQGKFKQWRRGSLVVDSTVKIFIAGIGLALLFAAASIVLIRNFETQRLYSRIDALASTVESAVRVACFTKDDALSADVGSGLMTNDVVAGVKISAGDEVLFETQRAGEAAGIDLEGFSITRPVYSPFNPGEIVGEIRLMADNDLIQKQAAGYSVMSAAVLMLQAVVVAWLVALVMLRSVVRPIRVFFERVQALKIDSGQHIMPPEGNADNEIGRLVHVFNGMLDKVAVLLASEQKMREKISLNESRLRSLVENSPDIIARYDRDCRRVFVNPAYIRQTGTPAGHALDKSVDDVDVWQPVNISREEYRNRLQRVMDSGKPDQILVEWMRDDGQWVSHEMHVVAEYDSEGKAAGTLAIGRDVTERKAAERQLLHQATYDALTGLPNRRLFNDRLYDEVIKAGRGGHQLALLFIDLDRFKEVNDTLGHGIGDRLLVEAAQRIRGCVRESDIVARLAGDEFVVILTEISCIQPVERVAKKIVAVMAQTFHFGEHSAFVSASIGIAVYPQDADSPERLVGCADQAMYAAKDGGRNSFSFFTSGMLEQAQQRLQLNNDLSEALSKKQLEVHYQPIIEIATGRAVKAEALLRWRHPVYGMVPPDQFIPIAEETGLIHEIGGWVLGEAMETAKSWKEIAGQDSKPQISVNMSPRQFTKGSGDQIAIDLLQTYGLDPAHITIEITEGILLEDSAAITEKLERLRGAGIQISLDDFGTGYSAMSYLKKFNIDYLKIDRSFVRDLETDPGDRAIAEAIVVMAHRLGLKVIAEGVETTGQQALLEAVGCEYAQGYLHAKPMPAQTFLAYVENGMQDTEARIARHA